MKRTHPLIIWAGIIIITLTTVGYQEIKPLTQSVKIFNIFFIITAFSAFTYALASLTRYVVSGEMQLYFINKKIISSLDSLRHHVIMPDKIGGKHMATIVSKPDVVAFLII
ncbi:potassium channel family protein [Hydrotalea sp.]|uniref:potassium channel family protein n=1 Tax=Hydrotalea sp. TaxID=2881279 RepID=UPI00263225BC|nr:potassium channel family protein [Hydrotalea sp.]